MKYFNQIIITIFLIVGSLHAQMIHRYGTTTGNFLEIGVDSEGSAMGDAFVAVSDDISSIYKLNNEEYDNIKIQKYNSENNLINQLIQTSFHYIFQSQINY